MIRSLTGNTQLLGVIGDPIRHSLSPVIHNAALAELNIDFVYVAFPVGADNLKTALAGFAAIGLQGFNVTIPHKQTILPLLATVTPEAAAVGAVNTVRWTDQGWWGTNTDVLGFTKPLAAWPLARQGRVIVLGNGGAARAVVAGCLHLGCCHIDVVGRNSQKLEAFSLSWRRSRLSPPLAVHSWENLENLLPQADLIVNTTPLGMYPKLASPLTLAQIELLKEEAIAYDLIYTPAPTRFLSLAAEHGLEIIDGREMLVQQGAAALELWLQQSAPVDTMRNALNTYLGQ